MWRTCRPQRRLDRRIDGVVLVVRGDLLDRLNAHDPGLAVLFFGFLKDNEVPHEV